MAPLQDLYIDRVIRQDSGQNQPTSHRSRRDVQGVGSAVRVECLRIVAFAAMLDDSVVRARGTPSAKRVAQPFASWHYNHHNVLHRIPRVIDAALQKRRLVEFRLEIIEGRSEFVRTIGGGAGDDPFHLDVFIASRKICRSR